MVELYINRLINVNTKIKSLFILSLIQFAYLVYVAIIGEVTLFGQLFGIGLSAVLFTYTAFKDFKTHVKKGITIGGILVVVIDAWILSILYASFISNIWFTDILYGLIIGMITCLDLVYSTKLIILTKFRETLDRYNDIDTLKDTGTVDDIQFIQFKRAILLRIKQTIAEGFDLMKLYDTLPDSEKSAERDLYIAEYIESYTKKEVENEAKIIQHDEILEAISKRHRNNT